MNISGKIIEVLPLQSGMGRNGEWKKQSYVIEYNSSSQYPKKMMFTLWGDKISQFDIKKDQQLTVDFDIDCQEYNGRWYNDIRAWRVTVDNAENSDFPPTNLKNTDSVSQDDNVDFPF
ncbi:MAG: DUF3127 domain-containing protein [Bacteroidales bacterium]|jgi:hypothetical protein|nr:DUF3127 domain-containing protein [Bacteroidales bacterium]MBP5135455.1 DUF3127 domain-containing protein [Paludibacteraceae bacterium]MBR6310276.1 DUF3127 domain-containing protein [Paludibacteraceae bacterium]